MTSRRQTSMLLLAALVLPMAALDAGAESVGTSFDQVTVICSWEWQAIGGIEAPFSVEPAVCSGWLDHEGGALITFWALGSQTFGECDASAHLDFEGQGEGFGRLSWLNPAGIDGPRIEFLPASCEPAGGQTGGVLGGGVANFCDSDSSCTGNGLLTGYGGRVLVHFV